MRPTIVYGLAMKPVVGLFLLTLLAYSILALIVGGLFVVYAHSIASFSLLLVTLGWTVAGGLLLAGERRSVADLSEKANIIAGGRDGTVRVLPRSVSDESNAGAGSEKTADSPSNLVPMSFRERLPPWFTATALGLSVLVAGLLMIMTEILLGF